MKPTKTIDDFNPYSGRQMRLLELEMDKIQAEADNFTNAPPNIVRTVWERFVEFRKKRSELERDVSRQWPHSDRDDFNGREEGFKGMDQGECCVLSNRMKEKRKMTKNKQNFVCCMTSFETSRLDCCDLLLSNRYLRRCLLLSLSTDCIHQIPTLKHEHIQRLPCDTIRIVKITDLRSDRVSGIEYDPRPGLARSQCSRIPFSPNESFTSILRAEFPCLSH